VGAYDLYTPKTHTEKIKRWIAKHNLDIEARGVVMNPRTFEAMQKWFILTEEDKVFFLQSWR